MWSTNPFGQEKKKKEENERGRGHQRGGSEQHKAVLMFVVGIAISGQGVCHRRQGTDDSDSLQTSPSDDLYVAWIDL